MELLFFIIVFILSATAVLLHLQLRKEVAKKEALQKENTNLIAENALLEADQLKFQLQPHTLNNILGNLKVIASKIYKGIDSLSETLEYILYKGNGHLVSVKDEIGFLQDYLRLNELFILEIDNIKVDIEQVNKTSAYYDYPCVPHLITAYFLENAFKHGDVNHKDFLFVNISLINHTFKLTVTNKTTLKQNTGKGGLGLNNMKKRLDLLVGDKYTLDSYYNGAEYHSTLTIQLK